MSGVDERNQLWNARYQASEQASGQRPAAEVLTENTHLLPAEGRALDLACGLGANALLLARCGLEVWAWDYSETAIEQLAKFAELQNISLHTEVHDVIARPPAPASFDVIVVSRFLERALAPALSAALKPGGLLFYQTFTAIKASDSGPSNPAYLLGDNELLDLFADLRLRVYREENCLGDLSRGLRNMALLVAERV